MFSPVFGVVEQESSYLFVFGGKQVSDLPDGGMTVALL
jgi:hypothetical protein